MIKKNIVSLYSEQPFCCIMVIVFTKFNQIRKTLECANMCFHTNSLFFQCKLYNVGWCEQTTILHYLSILEVANIPDAIVLLSGHFPRTAFWDIGDRSTQPVPTNDKHILLYNDAHKYAHKFNIRYLKWLDGRPSSVWREKRTEFKARVNKKPKTV